MSLEKFGKIGVLMGGPSSEREISFKSGQAVSGALRESGLEVVDIDIKTSDKEEGARLISSRGIDCAFIALHGYFGEDGQIQEALESLKIPYTGSGVEASRLAMDKFLSRQVFERGGLKVPNCCLIEKNSYNSRKAFAGVLDFPLVVKPAGEGSSIGLSIVADRDSLDKAVDEAFGFDSRVIIEEYIEGREFTVGLLDQEALPVVEIVPKTRFFDYEAKYQPGRTDYFLPARLSQRVTEGIQQAALRAHNLLGCQGCSRVDIILNKSNSAEILEVNTIPGFTATSLLPKAAKAAGITFNQLCLKLIKLAYGKKEEKKIQFAPGSAQN